MKIKNRIQGVLFILGAYVQFLLALAFSNNSESIVSGVFLIFISIPLVFGLSAKGLIILFSDKKDFKNSSEK